ncbi:MAG: iron-containing alcohol dehydrogenase [Bacteroidales bacterium]|nr:iron-containing alcohol dehydrogenase [Bacteroidales bacterium]
MRPIEIVTPRQLVLGSGSIVRWAELAAREGWKRIAVLSVSPVWPLLEEALAEGERQGLDIRKIDYTLPGEPTTDYFEQLRAQAAALQPDAILGVGGGSVLDIAKLLAALTDQAGHVSAFFGKGLVPSRRIGLVCAPTTAGTGSEVSPNAILLDSADGEKKGIISPYLLPDCTLIDPALTLGLPPRITAETGMDALCHCLEAYINKFAHPLVDTAALRGIELVGKYLLRACRNGADMEAREALATASMLGGLCLGPVNTCGIHALSYGLAGKYHLSHGLANALLAAEVMRFNRPACLERYAAIARALDLPVSGDAGHDADLAIDYVAALSASCGIPQHLAEVGIRAEDIPEMAAMAMNVTRLLRNNPREIQLQDVIEIYQNIY